MPAAVLEMRVKAGGRWGPWEPTSGADGLVVQALLAIVGPGTVTYRNGTDGIKYQYRVIR